MEDTKFYKFLIFLNSLIPLTLLAWDAYFDNLGANPIEYFLRTTGVLTLVFLFLTLTITPLRKIYSWNKLIRFRRMLGLFAFFYGLLHLITYSIFDKSLILTEIIADVWQRPFIAFGMAAFSILVPLAVTSTNGMIKRIGGRNWQRLHRLSYLAAICGLVHFFMIQKSDYFYPIIFGSVLVFLLGFRILKSKIVAGKLSGISK